MGNQQELICVRCGAKGSIKKVKLHNMFKLNDEVEWFMCESCKAYEPIFEALACNFEDFPYFLEEDWEYGKEEDLIEKPKEEDIIDLNTPEGIEKAKKMGIIREKKNGKQKPKTRNDSKVHTK